MSRSRIVDVIVSGAPSDLLAEIRTRAEADGVSMNTLLVGSLAKRFRVAFEPSGRKAGPFADSGDIYLRMPIELRRKIQAEAAMHDSRPRDVIVDHLSDEFLSKAAA